MLTIQLLGLPRLWLDGRPLKVTRRKSRALVYFLAAHTAPVTREQLINLLWPDHDRRGAQQLLRTTAHGLHQALGAALVATNEALGLAEDVDVDVRRFERLDVTLDRDPQALAVTLELYRGDFLQDFELPDSSAFDDWLTVERERFRGLAVRGWSALAQQYEQGGRFGAALDALAHALALDPLREEIQRSAMRLHYLAGDRAAAIRRYEHLRGLLDDELGVPPMEETRALYQAIITDTLAPPARDVAAPRASPTAINAGQPSAAETLPFVGREAELRVLRGSDGVDKLTLVEGEPGIGKTRLLMEFLRTFDGLGLVGNARELERALPYQPLIEALRELRRRPEWNGLRANLQLEAVWLAEIARLLPEVAADVGAPEAPVRAPDESRLWEGLNQLLLALARQTRIVLFIDDLHWADAATLGVLGYLLRQTASAPIIFVAAARQAAPRSPLDELQQTLTREGRLRRLKLGRLSADDTAALARRLHPAEADALGAWLTRSAEGSPYIIAELVRYAREDGPATEPLNLPRLTETPIVPDPVYSLIQSRLARLTEAARRMLDTAVASGRDFDFDVVAQASDLGEQAALDALDELRAAGLARPLDGTRYTFDHSLTMEVAYREVGEARHRRIHRRVGEALEHFYHGRLDVVAGMLASHFAEGNDPERAAHYAYLAGNHAAGLAAWQEAAAFYRRALHGADPEQRYEILTRLGDAQLQAGQAQGASETLAEAVAEADARHGERSDAASAARIALAVSFFAQARYDEVGPLMEQVRRSGAATSAAEAEYTWATALSIQGADLAGAAEHVRTAQALLAADGSTARRDVQAAVAFELGSLAAQQGNLLQAVAHYRVALDIANDLPADTRRDWDVLARNNLAYHLLLLGDPDAEAYAEAGLELARKKGSLGMLPYLLSTRGEIALAHDDVAVAEMYFKEGLDLARRLAIPERVAGLTANLGLAALRRGDRLRAREQLLSALDQADALGTLHLAAQIRLWLVPLLPSAQAAERLAEARAIAERGGRRRLLAEVARLRAAPATP